MSFDIPSANSSTHFNLSPCLGAVPNGEGGWTFCVWAPFAEDLELILYDDRFQELKRLGLNKGERGYWHGEIAKDSSEARSYRYGFEKDVSFPDPASRWQKQGVHKASFLFDPAEYQWSSKVWATIPLKDLIFYELHVGTFSDEGSFAGLEKKLDYLGGLGVNIIEIMPVAAFPGSRNWGYDGVYPFAVADCYGGPTALQKLVDACHLRGMLVCLDVVYNHLGPEGNYLANFGPYFTNKYNTPWGSAVNLDGPGSDEVRRYFIENALYWFRDHRIDCLRLDATHALFDQSAWPFLAELREAVAAFEQESDRRCFLIAESDATDPRLLESKDRGGFGLDGQWMDDFHHAVHTSLTRESLGYYLDFNEPEVVGRALANSVAYTGQYSPFRERRHGRSYRSELKNGFVTCIQNHDQVGNRMLGERLEHLVGQEGAHVAAAALLTSPAIPLLFMGEEFAASSPFQYFVSHGDKDLVEAVRRGRAEEFSSFAWKGDVPDPQALETFKASTLNWYEQEKEPHAKTLLLYKTLISIRKTLLQIKEPIEQIIWSDEYAFALSSGEGNNSLVRLVNFNQKEVIVPDLEIDGLQLLCAHSPQEGLYACLKDSVSYGSAPESIFPLTLPAKSFTLPAYTFALYGKYGDY